MTARSLGGAGVLVTRPAHLAGELIDAVTAAGGKPLPFPVIDIVPRDATEVAGELERMPSADVVVFVSRNAVTCGLDLFRGTAACIAAIGPATARALRAAGREPDIVPERGFDSEHLLTHPALADVDGQRVVIVRGDSGRELLAETLTERGATVDYLEVYGRALHHHDARDLKDTERRFAAGRVRFVTAMSVGTLENLLALLPRDCLDEAAGARLVTPSERVIQTAVKRLPQVRSLLADGPGATEMVDAMIADLETDNAHD